MASFVSNKCNRKPRHDVNNEDMQHDLQHRERKNQTKVFNASSKIHLSTDFC